MTAKYSAMTPARPVKVKIAVFMTVGLILLSIFLALGGPTGIAARRGLFGTKANLFSDLNLIAQIVFLFGLSLGAVFAHKGHISTHQYIQTGFVFFNIVLTIFIMVVAFSENVIPGLPANLQKAFALVATIHAALGLLAILCGVYLLLRMNQLISPRWRVSWWKDLMRFTLGLYWVVGIIGVVTYFIWYAR
ncbi:MAG TPA: hypothetical protein VF498_14885 [Anaerolineales bacterium]